MITQERTKKTVEETQKIVFSPQNWAVGMLGSAIVAYKKLTEQYVYHSFPKSSNNCGKQALWYPILSNPPTIIALGASSDQPSPNSLGMWCLICQQVLSWPRHPSNNGITYPKTANAFLASCMATCTSIPIEMNVSRKYDI